MFHLVRDEAHHNCYLDQFRILFPHSHCEPDYLVWCHYELKYLENSTFKSLIPLRHNELALKIVSIYAINMADTDIFLYAPKESRSFAKVSAYLKTSSICEMQWPFTQKVH